MSVNYSGKSRKIIKKAKPTVSIKVSTSDKNNQTQGNVDSEASKSNRKKSAINKQNVMKISVTSGSKTKTQKQKEIMDELKNKLNLLQNKIELERQNCISENDTLNEQLKEKSQEINSIKNENDTLVKKLKKISDEIDANIQMEQIYRTKTDELEKNIKKLNNSIEVRKKEIILEEKRKEKNINDIKKLNEIINLNDEEKLKVLYEEYTKKLEIIQNTEKEIKNLKSVYKIHSNCDKVIYYLKSKYNLLKNDFQFETKKSSMIELQNSSRSYNFSENNIQRKKIRKIKKIKDEVDNPLCQSTRNNNRSRISKNCRNYIEKQFNDLGNDNYINKNLSIDFNNETENANLLFTDNEEKVLQKLIPNYYLRTLKEKFGNLESQKIEAMDKFNKGNKEVKETIKNKKIKIDLSKLNINAQKKIKANLTAKLAKTHRLIIDLKDNIKKINKEIKAKKTQIISQEKTYKQLVEHLNGFKKQTEKSAIKS